MAFDLLVFTFTVIVPLFILGLVFLTLDVKRRANRLIVRDPTNHNHYIEEFLVIEVKDKETQELRWKSVFWQKKLETEKPPAEAISIGKRGKKYAECYKISDNQYCWITDKGVAIESKVEDGKRVWHIVDKNIDQAEEKTIIDSFRPFNVTQRQALINQFKKAYETSHGKNWTVDKIIQFSGGIILGVIIIMAIIFGQDIYNLHIKSQTNMLTLTDNIKEITNNQAYIMSVLGHDLQSYGLQFNVTQTPKMTNGSNVLVSSNEKLPTPTGD